MKYILFILVLFSASALSQVDFEDYFEDKSLRIDYFHTGDSINDSYSFDELIEEPYWGGSKINLLDKFDYGTYKIVVNDAGSGKPIYTRTYSTLFSEWQTTEEAKNVVKTFSETAVIPYPKKEVNVEFYSRNNQNKLIRKFELNIDPADYFIKKEMRHKYRNFEVLNSGDAAEKVDIVIIPEGYTQNEMKSFREDCQKFAGYLFNASPYKENKNKFNIWGIEAPSGDSGTDIPADSIWKNTLVGSNFYTFDLERYLMTAANKTLRDVAANAPYDQIYILVNTPIYGGGSIYNHYSVCVNNNKYSEYIFTHEFGHGFAFLADEYYTSDVAYEEFYPLNIEPLEPNITTLVNFESKWKELVDEDTPVPTPDTLEDKSLVGVFEGGGYMSKGIYRPMQDCTMKSISVDNFCEVCKKAIAEMIRFYSE